MLKDPGKAVTFLSSIRGLNIRLKSAVRTNVNGREYSEPGLYAKFENGRFVTDRKELIEELCGLLEGPNSRHWRNVFQMQPSQEVIERYAKAAEAAKKASDRVMAEKAGDIDTKEVDKFHDFLKSQRTTAQKVGRRSSIG